MTDIHTMSNSDYDSDRTIDPNEELSRISDGDSDCIASTSSARLLNHNSSTASVHTLSDSEEEDDEFAYTKMVCFI